MKEWNNVGFDVENVQLVDTSLSKMRNPPKVSAMQKMLKAESDR